MIATIFAIAIGDAKDIAKKAVRPKAPRSSMCGVGRRPSHIVALNTILVSRFHKTRREHLRGKVRGK